jgi:protease I
LTITPDTKIEALKSDQLSALIIPGGWAPDKLRRYPAVTNLVGEMDTMQKPLGIICHGGLVAISAGIVKGHRATGSLGIKDDLVNAGATWVDEPAFRDANQVWGRVVEDIPAFCRELVKILAE